MKGISIIIPVFNKLEITQKCINHIREFNVNCSFEIIIVDNGSTDRTPDILSDDKNIIYIRNPENPGISKAYNHGVKVAKYDVLCFMHNDVFIFKERWPEKMRNFIFKSPNTGIIGLYGARRVRREGSFMGRSIVHAKLKEGNMREDYIEVAVVDGLIMTMQKKLYEKIEGFDERYVMHYYDKDISLKAHTSGHKNYIINIPFIHKGAGTRSAVKIEEDIALRKRMKGVFLARWEGRLPLDVRTKGERVRDWIKKYV